MKQSVFVFFFFLPFLVFSQQNSVLSTGSWYKIAVDETGVYKITYEDLANYGIDPGQVDPRNIALYGNPAGMLPEPMDEPYYTDLSQMAIRVSGEEDGSFDPDDYILFYGQGPVIWKYDSLWGHFHHIRNLYSLKTYYFLTIGESPGKRIQVQPNSIMPYTSIIYDYDFLVWHEADLVNPSKSGQRWLGETFHDENTRSFDIDLSQYNIATDNGYFKTVLAASCTESNHFTIKINDNPFARTDMPIVSGYYQKYKDRTFDTTASIGGGNLKITFTYDHPNDSSTAWLDYFELQLKMAPVFAGDQLNFRTTRNVGTDSVSYFFFNHNESEKLMVWNVTDPVNVAAVDVQDEENNISWFQLKTEKFLEFCGFNGNTYYSPAFEGQVENQNLHTAQPPDLLIITHPDFLEQANQLAAFHGENDGMSVGIFTTDQIYNEFSSGAQDVMAIRNFVRYLRDRSGDENKPAYLLLFGDASYDYLNRVENNTNFVPTYESRESANIVWSIATDDYFGLKGFDNMSIPVLSVGRIPIKSVEEANAVMDKIVAYNSPDALGKWKNEMMFIADDGDNNLHLKQADFLANEADTNSPVFNQTKNYFDFFQRIQTDNGPRYPEVNAAITGKTNEGVFYVNYNGHGGVEQLGEERVLSKDDLDGWSNSDKLPLWVLATGDVARYDDPEYTSLGEAIFLKEGGGAIALISPTRATFSSASLPYIYSILKKVTDESLQADLHFGDLIFPSPLGGDNDLKFILLGDPALKIRFPVFNVSTTTLNGMDIEDFTDTIPPGSFLTLKGEITSKEEGSLQTDFNGTVYLKIYAPPTMRSTLGNNGNPVTEVEVQDSVLAEGTATVGNGEYEMQILLPAKYYEGFGNLKLSWYAENGETDASGYDNQLMFGGEPTAIAEGNEFFDHVKVYPTVFTDYLNVELPDMNQPVVFRVYNTVGTEVYSTKSNSPAAIERLHIPGLAKGMYILNVHSAKGSGNFKIFRY